MEGKEDRDEAAEGAVEKVGIGCVAAGYRERGALGGEKEVKREVGDANESEGFGDVEVV